MPIPPGAPAQTAAPPTNARWSLVGALRHVGEDRERRVDGRQVADIGGDVDGRPRIGVTREDGCDRVSQVRGVDGASDGAAVAWLDDQPAPTAATRRPFSG